MDQKIAKALGRKFGFTLKNDSGATKDIVIFPALFDTSKVVITQDDDKNVTGAVIARTEVSRIVAAGFAADCVIDDGTIATGVTATAQNSKFSIRWFLDYIKQNAQQIKEITIQANNSDVFSKILTVAQVSPLAKAGEDYLNIEDYFNTFQQQSNKVVITDIDLFVDRNTLMSIPLDSGREVTFTIKFK